jgi:hypothetical protein
VRRDEVTKDQKSQDQKSSTSKSTPAEVPFPEHEVGKKPPKDPVVITVNRYTGPR